jgi:anti-sigma regulatory factor (Ser/Thr protein kinase)
VPTNSQATRIRQFLIDSVDQHPSDLVSITAKKFGVTRQAVHRHLHRLCREGILRAAGHTKARTYFLGPLDQFSATFRLQGLEEHVPWDENIRPQLASAPKNVIDILGHGFTEMLNNAIDHSESESANARLVRTAQAVTLEIEDQGVGIFRKIQRELHLPSERQSVFELFKGKLTTDPVRHTGEGVFFTSRMVDRFTLQSGKLRITHDRKKEDWQIEELDTACIGTLVRMTVSLTTKLQVKDLFNEFADAEELTFSRSHAPIKLAQFGLDRLVSRSQARRVVARFDRFSEVVLDFSDVEFIGQAFADEVFRVFQTANPTVRLTPINTNRFVAGMIHRTKTVPEK